LLTGCKLFQELQNAKKKQELPKPFSKGCDAPHAPFTMALIPTYVQMYYYYWQTLEKMEDINPCFPIMVHLKRFEKVI